MQKRLSKIAVIGAGTMGVGVTIDLLLHGIDTVLIDISSETLKVAEDEIVKGLRFAPMMLKDKSSNRVDNLIEKVQWSTNLSEVKGCDFIVENVTENVGIKERLYKELDRLSGSDICIGMNTSCISITQMGSYLGNPERLVGVHFMNPVFMKKTVEVIKGFHTSNTTLETLKVLLTQLGKESIVVNDLPGFVSNRISHLFMNEAAFVVQDQVAKPEDIDNIFKKCYGHLMGPLETADLIGLDTVVHSLDVLFASYQDSKFRCCPLLRKMVHAGNLGRKSGNGFYTY